MILGDNHSTGMAVDRLSSVDFVIIFYTWPRGFSQVKQKKKNNKKKNKQRVKERKER